MQYEQRHTRTPIPLDRLFPIPVGLIGNPRWNQKPGRRLIVHRITQNRFSAFTGSKDPEVTMRLEDKVIRHSGKIIGNNPGGTLYGSLGGIT